MPKPATVISACIFMCGSLLREKDDVFSAIRIADIYNAPDDLPPGISPEQVALPVNALFIAKFSAPDGSRYTIGFRHIRPDGSEELLSEQIVTLQAKSNLPEYIPRGVYFELKITVRALAGVHYFVAGIDGEEVARCPFSIQFKPSEMPETNA